MNDDLIKTRFEKMRTRVERERAMIRVTTEEQIRKQKTIYN